MTVTESEWLASSDPGSLLEWLTVTSGPAGYYVRQGSGRPLSDRKLRLFACAWWRCIVPHSTEQEFLLAGIEEEGSCLDPQTGEVWTPDNLLGECQGFNEEHARTGAVLLREIAGNPFRPVELPLRRAWLTPQTVELASLAYRERDWTVLPVLADALEEAGCGEGFVIERDGVRQPHHLLAHLRGWEPCPCLYGYGPPPGKPQCSGGWARKAAPCVRGCWAVDLLTGRE
jgi:hypothetical protein